MLDRFYQLPKLSVYLNGTLRRNVQEADLIWLAYVPERIRICRDVVWIGNYSDDIAQTGEIPGSG